MRLILILILAGAPVLADEPREVDLELFLAVDVSRSMSPQELEIQRRGYAKALASGAVYDAISSGLIGEIAITYVEWAGANSQNIVVPWTLIDSAQAARDVADTISVHFDPSLRRTSISGILSHAIASIDANEFNGLRRVIDISGDGPNNQGDVVTLARDRALSAGITINGLPLMTTDALSQRWGIPDLDVYYTECVIGGPGAFVLPVYDWAAFPEAIQRKLIMEIANVPVQPQATLASVYNCRVGEEIFERNMRQYYTP